MRDGYGRYSHNYVFGHGDTPSKTAMRWQSTATARGKNHSFK
jgi:hypothetical protein